MELTLLLAGLVAVWLTLFKPLSSGSPQEQSDSMPITPLPRSTRA